MGEPASDPKLLSLEEITESAARFLDEKRAEEIKILNVRDTLFICSYFIIATASSARHLQTLADGLQRHLKPTNLPRIGAEGNREGRWVCLDHSELVIHLFEREARAFYDFDHLWGDAPRVPFEPASPDEVTADE